jgi:hypothetical protein
LLISEFYSTSKIALQIFVKLMNCDRPCAKGFVTATATVGGWWVGQRTRVFSLGEDFIVDCGRNIEEISAQAANLILDLFRKCGAQIEAADAALAVATGAAAP